MYDPSIGAWFQEDPIGFLAGDANLRRIVGNNAVNRVDPSGLDDEHSEPPGKMKDSAKHYTHFPKMSPELYRQLYPNGIDIPDRPVLPEVASPKPSPYTDISPKFTPYRPKLPEEVEKSDFKLVFGTSPSAFTGVTMVNNSRYSVRMEADGDKAIVTLRVEQVSFVADLNKNKTTVTFADNLTGKDLFGHEVHHLRISKYVADAYSARFQAEDWRDLVFTSEYKLVDFERNKEKIRSELITRAEQSLKKYRIRLEAINQYINDQYDADTDHAKLDDPQKDWLNKYDEKIEALFIARYKGKFIRADS